MKRLLALFLLTIALVLTIASCTSTQNSNGGDITIASKSFTEQDILSELLAQQIQTKTGLKVNVTRLGGSLVCHQAITSGKIDAYIEYTGSAYTGILKQKPIADPKEVFHRLQTIYAKQFNLAVMPSLGFENTFAMIIRGDDARRYNLQTLSQATQYTPQWRGGFGYEFWSGKTATLDWPKPTISNSPNLLKSWIWD